MECEAWGTMEFVDFLPLLLVLLFLVGTKPVKGAKTINESYLSISTGSILRGLFAIVVVLHHISKSIDTQWMMWPFRRVGYLAVAVFFFLSGYGLQKSYLNSENYKNKFLRKRLPKILIPYALTTVLYWIAYTLSGEAYSVKDIFTGILKGQPIVGFSWYILGICYFYVAYGLIMHLCKQKYSSMILCAGLWFVVYAIACRAFGYGSWWYNTAYLLVIGMFWAVYEEKLIRWVTSHYWGITAVSICAFILSFSLQYFLTNKLVLLGLQMISSGFFVALVILFTLKNRLESRAFSFLGKISLEIYLLQKLVMAMLRSSIVYMENDSLWAVMVILGCIVSGMIMHKALELLSRLTHSAKKTASPLS